MNNHLTSQKFSYKQTSWVMNSESAIRSFRICFFNPNPQLLIVLGLIHISPLYKADSSAVSVFVCRGNIHESPHLPPKAGLMVKSWSSTLSRCSVFILRDLVTSGGFFANELEENTWTCIREDEVLDWWYKEMSQHGMRMFLSAVTPHRRSLLHHKMLCYTNSISVHQCVCNGNVTAHWNNADCKPCDWSAALFTVRAGQ